MRTLLTLFLALCATGIMAQGIVDREVGDFHEIKVYDLIEVNLIKSDENRILIKGKNTQDINFVNKDGVLKLKMPLEKKFQGEDTFIEVYYTDIRVIDANEGARIIGNELFVQDRIELRAQEGSEIEIGLQVQDAKIRAVTGGIINASGIATNQVIVLNTGGVFEGRNLKTDYTNIRVSAGGEAELFAAEEVEVQIRAGGDVRIYGDPQRVNKDVMMGGRVYFLD
ncbi:head GIN domain-containing protein [Robiginitalea aurantiaca]|uniref:Head GIN domain-containing protein n=1 Tax=Robiginitalea aurantiaca TaxID=3056915 RepID=A0ABT7WHW9_9FLAO|nr:head GIN domain-containing protein [Robiginitalea aurantiaca]MDM9632518.1 head GIN domain-containing protein [Robiginitalea aurantiaca]